jgi:DNA polymerase-1
MIRCEGDPELRRLGVRLLLQIHDELVFEVPDRPTFVERAKTRITKLMENPFKMRVPIDIDIDVAHAWGDAKS